MSNRANAPRNVAFNKAEVNHSEILAACFNTLRRSDISLVIKMA